MKPNPTTAPRAENPRTLLAAFLDRYLSRPGALETFLERVARAVNATDEHSHRNFVWSVRAGRRAIPQEDVEKWARSLGLLPDSPEWVEMARLASAGRAYGKTNGRDHLARMEAEKAAVLEENRNLRHELEEALDEAARLRSELTRLTAEGELGE